MKASQTFQETIDYKLINMERLIENASKKGEFFVRTENIKNDRIVMDYLTDNGYKVNNSDKHNLCIISWDMRFQDLEIDEV